MLIASASQLDEYTAGFLLVVRTDTVIIGHPASVCVIVRKGLYCFREKSIHHRPVLPAR